MATRLFGNVKAGATSVSTDVLLLKTSDGTADTGKLAANLTAHYRRQGGAVTAITLSDLATIAAAYTSGGVKEADATNLPGIYRLDLPDAMFAAGADYVVFCIRNGTTSVYYERFAIESHGIDDVYGVVSLALPNAAPGATNGLPQIGVAPLTNLDATVSSRSTYAGGDTGGTTTLLSRLTSTRAGLLDNLDAAISTRSTYAGGDTSGTTTLLGRVGGALTISGGKVAATVGTGDDADAASVKATIGAAGAGLTSLGDTRLGILDRLSSMLVLVSGSTYRFTAAALALAPAGGGGGTGADFTTEAINGYSFGALIIYTATMNGLAKATASPDGRTTTFGDIGDPDTVRATTDNGARIRTPTLNPLP